jgi:hypothetical protein
VNLSLALKVTLALALSGALMGCSANNNLSGSYGDAPPVSGDFLNSTMNVTTDFVVADGIASVVVVIYLKNKSNQPVRSYQPKYSVAGSGIVPIPCTLSNEEGISVCLVKSTEVGQRTFRVTNIAINLTSPINFTAPSVAVPGFGIASAPTLRQQGMDGATLKAVAVTSIAEPIAPFVLEKDGTPGTTRARTNFPGLIVE